MRKKIHCLEVEKACFDDYTLKECTEMIGFYEPCDTAEYTVTCEQDGAKMDVDTNFEAVTVSSLEEVKAMLKLLLLRRGY